MLFYSLKTATFSLSIDNGFIFHLYFIMKLFMNFYFRLFTTILFLVLLSYLISFRLVVTIIAVVVITPQIPMRYYNVVVDMMHSSGVFVDYGQAKRFVFRFTWGCIFLYLLLNGMGGA